MVLPMYSSATTPRPVRKSAVQTIQGTWRKWKASIVRAGRTIKTKAYQHRYRIAYSLLLATIAIIAIRQSRNVRRLKGQLQTNEKMLQLAKDGVKTMTPKDLRAVQGALANEDVASYLAGLASSPKKLEQMNVLGLAQDLCKMDRGLCKSGIMPRANMPQVNLGPAGMNALRTHLARAHYSVGKNAVNFDAASLKPLQTDLLTTKVVGMAGAMLNGDLDSTDAPLLVAAIGEEMLVVNGHHRWAAARIAGKRLKAHVVKYHPHPTFPLLNVSPGIHGKRHVLQTIKTVPGTKFASLAAPSKMPSRKK
jgi:hypothetical protein